MSELKPCPFCGGESEYLDDDNAESVEAWNSRVKDNQKIPTLYKYPLFEAKDFNVALYQLCLEIFGGNF